jgi:hypothetical protein
MKTWFFNTLEGVSTSLPQQGHLAIRIDSPKFGFPKRRYEGYFKSKNMFKTYEFALNALFIELSLVKLRSEHTINSQIVLEVILILTYFLS